VALILALACIVLLAILIVSYVAFTSLNRSSTASYSKTIQAQEIAMGGLQDILGDLHSEIIAGSTSGGYSISGVVAYVPANATTAQPARLGYTAASWTNDYNPAYLAPTLVRVSRASQDGNATDVYPQPSTGTYTGGTFPINRASAVSTTNAFGDGTYISAARWNKTYLLATNAASVPTPFNTTPPDWVYVTRTGSRVCQASELASLKPSANLAQVGTGSITPGTNPPASPVVGRYAFIMYDEGALLDVNAAGSPSSLITGSPSAPVTSPSVPSYTDATTGLTFTLPGKSNLASVDLTQIPGLSGAQTAAVDPFLKWRNAGSIASTGTSGPNFLQISYTYQTNGFVSFSSGDNPVLGRQDLINYFTSIDPNINTGSATYSKALPYLGTFSRALNEPSWYPPLNASASSLGGNNNVLTDSGTAATPGANYFAYNTNAESNRPDGTVNPNRDLANLRFSSPGTVTHYSDTGTTTTYAVTAGTPLLQHRFSLARIGWLSHTGPNAAYSNAAAAIQACFGLVWDSTNNCWNYVQPAPAGQTTGSYIESLSEVAAESTPREPNFFELLKAGILNGSLGQEPGMGGADPGNTANPSPHGTATGPGDAGYSINGVAGLYFNIYSASADPQVMQIGANIIDQYTSYNYPTAIYFPKVQAQTTFSGTGTVSGGSVSGSYSVGTAELRLYNTVFGQKNLPYISRVLQIETGTLTSSTSPASIPLNGYYQPELWNPYQASAVAPSAGPTQFRVHAYGQTFNVATPEGTLATAYHNTHASVPSPSPIADFTDNLYNGAAASNLNFIGFSDTPGTTGSVFYPRPHFLLQSDTTSAQQTTGTYNLWSASTCSDGYNQFAAFFCGAVPNLIGWTGTTNTSPVGGGTYPTGGYLFDATVELGIPGYYMTLATEYYDGTNWLPYGLYSRLSVRWYEGIIPTQPTTLGDTSCWDNTEAGGIGGRGSEGWMIQRPDPRTDRFSGSATAPGSNSFPNSSMRSDQSSHICIINNGVLGDFFPQNQAFYLVGESNATNIRSNTWATFPGGPIPYSLFLQNESAAPTFALNALYTSDTYGNAYYADADSVVRPADGYAANASDTTDTGDGMEIFATSDPQYASVLPNTAHVRRPVILGRPFRDVGELGYAFRDDPYRTLDFWTSLSADSALMDLFSTSDQPTVIAGQINPNNAPLPILQAVISGGAQNSDLTGATDQGMSPISSANATALAKAISAQIATAPLLNRANLASLGPVIQTYASTGTTTVYLKNKAAGEEPIRALSSVTNTRTWNLLIDVIAQAGQLSPKAAGIGDFIVQGERRYWLHIAIDRYTGRIIDQQLEPVYE
jgi:hypothetical protein